MDLVTLVPLLVKGSIALTVFALGLDAEFRDAVAALRRPALFIRSLVAMHLVMPALAVMLALGFGLHPAVQIALIALALSPVPPVLPRKQLKAGGSPGYVLGLLVAPALAAIVYIPLALMVVERFFGLALGLAPSRIAQIVLIGILAPLAAGMLVRGVAPGIAARIAGPLNAFATALLVLVAVAILIKAWPGMVALFGNGTLAAFAVFIVLGMAVGHWLGGPAAEDRTVLAFATALRHPGLALAIAAANFPDQKLVTPAVLLYLLAGMILSVPYLRWRRAQLTSRGAGC